MLKLKGLVAEDCDLSAGDVRLSPGDIAALVARFWSCSDDVRARLPRLPPERSRIILTGSVLLEAFGRWFRCEDIMVSRSGLRHGILLDSSPEAGPSEACLPAAETEGKLEGEPFVRFGPTLSPMGIPSPRH